MKVSRRGFLSTAAIAGAAICFDRRSIPVHAQALASDPRRPQFHLLPAANWMNDPNGPIYWNGQYHMFYQYNPNGAYWGDMHWAHSVSPDMVRWTHLPVALAPTPGTADAQGCFSGTAAVRDGVVTMIYTGVVSAPEDRATIRAGAHSLRESQCLATSSDPLLRTWTKRPAPVIPAPPPGMTVSGFRDPSPWRHGDDWYMVVGSGIPRQGGAILLYRSPDLAKWEYLHLLTEGTVGPIAAPNPVNSGDMWECPDFFPLGDKHVLMYSTEGKVLWESGEFDAKDLVFHSQRQGVFDYGAFYAAKTQTDKAGNRILWGWIEETRPVEEYRASGWAGMMSLPRILDLDRDGQVTMTVASEVQALRRNQQSLRITADEAASRRQLAGMSIPGACGELLCTLKRSAAAWDLSLVGAEDAAAWMQLRYDPAQPSALQIDGKPFHLAQADSPEIELHFYIDGSVIEAFVDRRIALTKRVYYPGDRAPDIQIRIAGNTASLSSLTTWQLAPISSNRLTT